MRHLHAAAAAVALSAFAAPATMQPVPSAESTLLLTWFDDPTTTMVVQWLTGGDTPPRAEGSASATAYEVPEMEGQLAFDGDPSDWLDAGLRTDFLPLPEGGWPDATDVMAGVRTAWTPEGLAVLVTVVDRDARVKPTRKSDWGDRIISDRVEFRMTGADPAGESFRFQVGRPDPGGEPATVVTYQPGGTGDAGPPTGVTLTDDGYVVETLLPFSAMPMIDAEPGGRLGLQVEVFDPESDWAPVALSWAGSAYPQQAGRRVAPLVLAPAGRVDPVRARVDGRRPMDGAKPGPRMLAIGGEPRLIGEIVTLKSGDLVIGEVELDDVQGFAGAEFELTGDFAGDRPAARFDAVSVELDGAVIARELLENTFWAVAPEPAALTAVSRGNTPGDLPAVEVSPFAASGWYVQRAQITGLEPGTDYAVNVPGRLKPVRFRTAPATLEEPLVFAEGGDVGTSHHVGMLHDEAAAWDPLFGVVGGDCAYGNGLDPEAWFDYLQLWNEHMTPAGGRSVPMICNVGNHETVGNRNGGHPDDSPFFRALFGPLFSDRGAYAALDFGAGDTPYATFYLLDSGHTADHGGHQTQWLERALLDRADVLHPLASYHVPAYPSVRDFDGSGSAAAREHWVPLFEEHGIAVAFEHHDHAYKRTHPLIQDEPADGGVLYLGDGAWGRTPRSVSPDRPYLALALSERNVMRITLNPDGTREVLAVNEDGDVLDDVTLPARAAVVVGAAD